MLTVKKMKNQMVLHKSTGKFYRVIDHGYITTHVQLIENIWDERLILPVYETIGTHELKFYPWTVGDKT